MATALSSSMAAAPISYKIDFTLDTGTIVPTAGSFAYDPIAQVFSGFIVNWNGAEFDLTAAANAPLPSAILCPGSTATAAWAFDFLTSNVCTSGVVNNRWTGSPADRDPLNQKDQFFFEAVGNSQSLPAIAAIAAANSLIPTQSGTYSVTVATNTPEPSTFWTLGFGSVGMAIAEVCRRRRSHPCSPNRNAAG